MDSAATFAFIWFVCGLIIKILIAVYYVWVRFWDYVLSWKLPGPFPSLPVFGNLPWIMFKKKPLLISANELIAKYDGDFRFWFGGKLLLIAKHPETINEILTTKVPTKLDACSFLKYHISDTDQRWLIHKKLIKPFVNVKFIIDNIPTIQDHTEILLDKLSKHSDRCGFDFTYYIRLCYADIFGEIILGKRINSQNGKNHIFVKSIETNLETVPKQVMYDWFKISFFCRWSKWQKAVHHGEEIQKNFIENIIRKSWERRKLDVFGENKTRNVLRSTPIVDKIADFVESNPDVIENEEFRDYLLSIFIMSQSAMSAVTSFTLMCLALHPSCQEKVYTELKLVLGDNNNKSIRNFKYEDLYKLKYLEMCILEAMRLAPIEPFAIKTFTETIMLKHYRIAAGCTTVIPYYALNRSEALYEKPDYFHPEHFLPENIKLRNIQHTGFGFGTKECIGKQLSLVGIKLVIANIVNQFYLESDNILDDCLQKAQTLNFLTQTFNLKVKLRSKLRY